MSGDTTNFTQKTNLQLLRAALLGGEPLTVGELQAQYFTPAVSRLIDPIAYAAQQEDPRYLAAAQAIDAEVRKRHQQRLDPGAAALDVLSKRMAGLNLNLSGFRKDPEISYPLEPGVSYQLKKTPSKVGGMGGDVEYISFDNVPMADWDIPSDFHAASNVTVRHLGDVEELVREHLKANPKSSLRLYQTPGGFRAWDLSQRMTPSEYAPQSEAMKVDGDYIRLAQQKTPSEAEGLTFGGPGFASRISAKPGRAQDWVAQPLTTLRGKDSIPDPTSERLVNAYHDQPIRRHYQPSGPSPAALQMLERQAATASPMLRTALANARLLGR